MTTQSRLRRPADLDRPRHADGIGAAHRLRHRRARARFYERAIGCMRSIRTTGPSRSAPMRRPAAHRAARRQPAPAARPAPATGLLSPGHPACPRGATWPSRSRAWSQVRWPLDGASDHLVSEALYLSDPDGNGIEIYRDRPREEWRRSDDQLEMATLPLDLRDVMNELAEDQRATAARVPRGRRIGHVHLQVAELADTEAFYSGVLGFDVMVRGYPGALFVSAGGYHHHLGLNTWHSAGALSPTGGIDRPAFLRGRPSRTTDALTPVLERIRRCGVAARARTATPSSSRPVGQHGAAAGCHQH